MGSPCQFLSRASRAAAREQLSAVAAEAWRIEEKFSRYLAGNVVHRINTAGGEPVAVDEETASLLDFAATLHDLSDGRFDITSGVLREVWTFDGGDELPDPDDVSRVLARVGWRRTAWRRPVLRLEPGMEIDFGGIGKEYAVDRAAAEAAAVSTAPCLVNFGGDLAAPGSAADPAWQVGIETPGAARVPCRRILLEGGALATSGDARRFLLRKGVRYSHILDPLTGWPVREAPRSVTVAADTCTEAGMLSTLAMLKGAGAERFLEEQGMRYWCVR